MQGHIGVIEPLRAEVARSPKVPLLMSAKLQQPTVALNTEISRIGIGAWLLTVRSELHSQVVPIRNFDES
jgi:hypothetical protein